MKKKILHAMAALLLALGIVAALRPATEVILAEQFRAICAEHGGEVIEALDEFGGHICGKLP